MLEEQLKNEIAVKYFKKFVCTDIIKRIDFSVKNDYGYLLWAEAKQQPTDIYKMLAQLLITIKADAWNLTPPKFLGCFDNEKIAFVQFYDVQSVFNLNDFNWTQTPSQVDDKTIATVKNTIDKNKIFTFYFNNDEPELKTFIADNFKDGGSLLSTLIDKNNFIFVYQKWCKAVKPYINADFEKLKKSYAVYDCDFFLAELNIDDNGTTDISDDRTVNEDFYITFSPKGRRPYQLLRKDGLGMDVKYEFGFKGDGLDRYAEFWKLYKRPPKNEYWNYIIERKDLLVPQDVRERKGAFFTPQIWVEKSQQYIADVLGENWQDEYYMWDCCAGTGNLLNGLTNKYHIFASTLDQQDVDVMKERIKNGANLLESHVFQFDFLNDEFNDEKVPQDLQKIISDPEKRKKLVIYINPPYAEGDSRIGKGRSGVAVSKIQEKYSDLMGYAKRELFVQFITRINAELVDCKLGLFSTLVHLQGSKFFAIRNSFNATLQKIFLVPANTFDNVKGEFSIGFQFLDLGVKSKFKTTNADMYDKNGAPIGHKTLFAYENLKYINDWTLDFIEKDKAYERKNSIGNIIGVSNDFQHQNTVVIENPNKPWNHQYQWQITQNNLIESCIYFAVRKCIEHSWINHYDQFLYPNDGWKTDFEFQTNCLIWTLFNGKNIIKSYGCTNHWIPFSENEVNAKALFDSHFMKDFLDGRGVPCARSVVTPNLFSDCEQNQIKLTERAQATPLQFTETAQSVLNRGRDLWRYYHTMDAANPNASLYDIKEFFQGRNDKGKMNATSEDPVYTDLLTKLKNCLRLLGEEIKPKVYEYGFLK